MRLAEIRIERPNQAWVSGRLDVDTQGDELVLTVLDAGFQEELRLYLHVEAQYMIAAELPHHLLTDDEDEEEPAATKTAA